MADVGHRLSQGVACWIVQVHEGLWRGRSDRPLRNSTDEKPVVETG